MKTIAVKIDEETFRKLNILRGEDTMSEFMRHVIDTYLGGGQNDNNKTISDPEVIRSLAIYLTEVLRLGNAPAYAGQNEKIKNLFNQFMDRIEEGRSEK